MFGSFRFLGGSSEPPFAHLKAVLLSGDHAIYEQKPEECLEAFQKCQITKEIMDKANKGAVLNPCPPFYRGEEVSADAIDSEYFVGYDFKKSLLVVQQAIMIYCLINSESS